MSHWSADVIVVGGGLAGLAAGATAAGAGRRVTVLEGAGGPGGRARTLRRSEFLFNLGPHALFRAGAGAAVLKELGVPWSGRVPPTSGGYAVRGGRLHTLPTGPVSLLTTGLLGLADRLELARFLAALPGLDTASLASSTVDAWIARCRFGPRVAELLRALVRLTTYGGDPSIQSAGAALDQLRLGARAGVAYLDGGWQTLVDGLVAALRRRGGEVRVRSRVERVEPAAGGGWSVWTRDGCRLRAPAVILAGGPGVASRLASPRLSWLEERAAEAVPVRAACLDVGLRRLPRARGLFALGIDRPEYLSVHSATARLAPEGAALVHVARYLGSEDAPADTEAGLERLIDAVQPGWRDEVVVRRFVPDLTVSGALATARQGGLAGRPGVSVPGAPGLYLAGDWVGRVGLLADASLASGREAARAALASAGAVAA